MTRFFFFNDTATTEIYTLSLHDALPISMTLRSRVINLKRVAGGTGVSYGPDHVTDRPTTLALLPLGYADGLSRTAEGRRSEEHTSELQSRQYLVCRLLLEKKKQIVQDT